MKKHFWHPFVFLIPQSDLIVPVTGVYCLAQFHRWRGNRGARKAVADDCAFIADAISPMDFLDVSISVIA